MGKSVLLSQIRIEIRRQGLTYRTEQTYIGWITRYIYYHNFEHPKNMGEKEVVLFLNHLVITRKVSATIQNQALQALHFLYRHVLGKPLNSLKGIVKGDTPYICQAWSNFRKGGSSAS